MSFEPEDDDDGDMSEAAKLRGRGLDIQKLASPAFAQSMPKCFDDYIEYRLQGVPREMSVIQAFEMIRYGMDMTDVRKYAQAMETNQYVRARFFKRLEGKDPKKDLWTQNKAVFHLLSLVEDPDVRDTTRLNAINTLNAMMGYCTLDEGLSRRVQQTLRDFERLDVDWSNLSGTQVRPDSHGGSMLN
jgi:hypothetical protein